MQHPDSVDRYFTEQVVGRPFTVDMGPSAGKRSAPSRGVLVEWLSGRAELTGVAFGSLWADEPSDPLLGRPLNLPGLLRWRSGLSLLIGLAWTATVVGLTLWWRA
jgi:hypothetical protein